MVKVTSAKGPSNIPSKVGQGIPNAVVNCPSTIIATVGTTVTSATAKTNGSVTFTLQQRKRHRRPRVAKETPLT
jgi:hypothetical protein